MGPESAPRLQDLLSLYGDAWNSHDLDAVVALHTEDSVFHLHAGDSPVAEGVGAVRAAFAASLAQWPDIHFHAEDVQLGARHAAVRWTVTATLAAALPIAADTSSATGRPVRFDALDLIVWRGRRISRKDTFVDAIALQGQLTTPTAG